MLSLAVINSAIGIVLFGISADLAHLVVDAITRAGAPLPPSIFKGTAITVAPGAATLKAAAAYPPMPAP